MKTKLESKKANWLNKSRQSIDLEPFFQRGEVWTKDKQQHFIDSILKGWGTPKIYLWKREKDIFACVDGKQRLISLFNFMDDQLPLSSEYSGEHEGKTYSKLPPIIQCRTDDYKFHVEVLSDAKDDEVFDFFKRLQRGTSLNFGENLYGTPGKMNEFIKSRLTTKKFFEEKIALPKTRYSHYAVCTQLCLLSIKGAKEDLKIKNIKRFLGEYANFNDKNPEAEKILSVINYLEKAFPENRDSTLRNRANVISIFYLVSDLSGRGDISGREKEIGLFFKKFVKDLQKEFEKKPENRDPSLLGYQLAVRQGADKIKSVSIRHDILLKKLAEKNKFFYKLLYPPISPRDEFEKMYNKARKILKITTVAGFDDWLIKNAGLKDIRCPKARGKKETAIGHIRNCIHYKEHGALVPRNLTKAIKVLEKVSNR